MVALNMKNETRGPRGPWVAHLRNRKHQGHNLNNFGRGPFDDVIHEI